MILRLGTVFVTVVMTVVFFMAIFSSAIVCGIAVPGIS